MDIIRNLFLAGWCADSIGAQLEFQQRRFSENEVEKAISFEQAQLNGIYSGQITDDSEMELSLLEALIESQHEGYFPVEHIALKYIEWYKSEPFDIGQTTMFSLSDANGAEDLINNAFNFNSESQSNGSLMRCIPLAVFGISRTDEQIMSMALSDSSLTHSNEIVQEITGVYCVAIANILRCRLTSIDVDVGQLLDKIYSLLTIEKIKSWFMSACDELNIHEYDAIKNEGHVKHAFIYFIYFLNHINNYTYIDAIKVVLANGGDTDTNAKIVGNLFGAYYSNCVPENILNTVINFDSTNVQKKFFKRPYKYNVMYGLELIDRIDVNCFFIKK